MSLPTGTSLGPYQVLAPIGAGGMGEVYRAHDPRLGRDVAVKVLRGSVSEDAERLGRFEQEARAAGALNHPNVLAVFDVGRHDHTPYVVSELLEGETLAARMRLGPLPLRKALDYAVQAARGLAAAHGRGIVHRDLKPANLFVTDDGRLKILDFGLAKLAAEDEAAAAAAPAGEATRTTPPDTASGTLMGTAGYMAPEQLRGGPADHRADLFALGVVLYEMLFGRRAFKGETVAETMYATLALDPLERAATSRTLPEGLERVLRRCLEKRPDERFQSAGDLAFQLEALAAGSLDAAGPPVSTVALAAPRRLRRTLPLLALGALAAAALAVLAPRLGVPPPLDSLAVLPFENATGDAGLDYLCDGLTETLTNELAQIRDLKVRTRSAALPFRRQQEDPRAAGRQLNVAAVVVGTLSRRQDQVSISVELIDVAENRQLWGRQYRQRPLSDVLEVQADIAREVGGTLRSRLAGVAGRPPTRDPAAYDLYLRGRQQWNRFREDGFLKAIDYFGQAIERDPGFALAYTGMADAYSLLGIDAHRPPREVMPKARAAAQRALEIDPALPEAHNSLAVYALFHEWDWPAAARSLQRALELRPHYSDAHHFRSHYLQAVGRTEEGVEAARRALELDPLSPIASAELGFAHYLARRYDEALAQYQATLEMAPRFVFANWVRAQAYEQKGMHAQALAEVDEALRAAPEWVYLKNERACALAAAGREAEARQAVAALQASGQPLDPGIVAWVFAQMGDRDSAFRWLDTARRERSSALVWLRVEPKWDRVRDDPRFAALLKDMTPPR
jgi:serine/threonine-protein kinase